MIFARALGGALRRLLLTDPRVVVLGEDIADPYGGAFKVTRGLSTEFPDRVRTTPVSEAAIAGVAAGLALEGFRPIAEIMFGDFITLCFDQVLNHIAKYPSMYAGQVACPVILRTPSGGGRGYGPTHSQSLEKHFLGVPHLRVVAASLHHDPQAVLAGLLARDEPVLYIEHKLLYPAHLHEPGAGGLLWGADSSPDFPPTVSVAAVPRRDCTATVVAYGHPAAQAARIIEKLAVEEEVFAELLVPAQIAPPDWGPIERSVEATGSLVTVEEGTAGWAWGTEVAAHVGRSLFGELRAPPRVLASGCGIVPSARRLEQEMLVSPEEIEAAVREAAA